MPRDDERNTLTGRVLRHARIGVQPGRKRPGADAEESIAGKEPRARRRRSGCDPGDHEPLAGREAARGEPEVGATTKRFRSARRDGRDGRQDDHRKGRVHREPPVPVAPGEKRRNDNVG